MPTIHEQLKWYPYSEHMSVTHINAEIDRLEKVLREEDDLFVKILIMDKINELMELLPEHLRFEVRW